MSSDLKMLLGEEKKKTSVPRMKCCGLPVEKGCFVYSIINLLIVSICIAACVYYIRWIEHIKWNRNIDIIEVTFHQMFCASASIFSLIAFIFAVLLCYGSYNKRPALIKAHFAYGMTVVILSTGGLMAYLVSITQSRNFEAHLKVYSVGVVILVIYSLPLALVFAAYKTLKSTMLPGNHPKLMNIYSVS